ncbi:MAG: aspartate--tRNA ligase [Clostridiaceae bacterium]|nr:aspartate--tRNA ligase [Clostridiaceae bacterium]
MEIKHMKRTNYCGLFSEHDVGTETVACGWVETKRDMGGVIFIDIVDREGVLQTVFNPEYTGVDAFALAERVRNQSVVLVRGIIHLRDDETVNPKISTGTVELRVSEAELLSPCAQLPFDPSDADDVREDLRLQYRFLDLRRPALLGNIRFRHQVTRAIRDFMDQKGFVDVETPILTKSTPEGARDYLVPSRVRPGSFYALPQSPQIFKQLLMVAGLDRYYQIARCFRDEDLRADRQPEFTQLDLEMSFVEIEDVLILLESLFRFVLKQVKSIEFSEAFPRFTWQEAMDKFGSDKPDLRFDLPVIDVTDIAARTGFSVFRKVVEQGGVVRAITVPGQADFSRTTIEELTEFAVSEGAAGMAWIAWRPSGEIYSILTKFIDDKDIREILQRVGAEPGDFILFSADSLEVSRHVTGAIRLKLADILGLRDPDRFAFAIVTDFPMFEYSEDAKRFVAQHHPFTMPYKEDLEYLSSDPARVRSQAYDFVLNGTELGSGSIRIHRSDIQTQVFKALGLSDHEIQDRFGFMLDAFQYGAPPHGGFAFGLDRLVMILAGEQSLRDVIAFPKIRDASCVMTQAPSTVDREQLEVLGIRLTDGGSAATATGPKEQSRRKRVAELDLNELSTQSRLNLAPEEQATMRDQLMEMITFADALHTIDTQGVPAMTTPSDARNIHLTERDDRPPSSEEVFENAPSAHDGFFFVPPVVE